MNVWLAHSTGQSYPQCYDQIVHIYFEFDYILERIGLFKIDYVKRVSIFTPFQLIFSLPD